MSIIVYAGYNAPPFAKGLIRDFRVLWMLEETGLAYDVKWFDLSQRGNKSEAYLVVNPFGRVPAIRDEDTDLSLFESGGIVGYLAQKSGLFLPATLNENAKANQWLAFTISTLEPIIVDHFFAEHFWTTEIGNKERQEKLYRQSAGLLAVLNNELEGHVALIGNEFSIADLMMGCVLRYTLEFDLLDEAPEVARYVHTLYGRPAFKRAYDLHLSGPIA